MPIKNPNHPQKGSSITVDPIRKLKDIKVIQKLLADNPRNRLLFIMGINNGLRVGDLLKVEVGQVRHLEPGDILQITESKTNKPNVLMLNKAVHTALHNYLAKKAKPADSDFLFVSRKGQKALTIQSVNALVKSWTKAINLKGNYGAHSLRKTWGYIQRTQFGIGFEVLCKRFNHSSPAVTMRYRGLGSNGTENRVKQ